MSPKVTVTYWEKKDQRRTGETRLEDPSELLGHNCDSTPGVIIRQRVILQQLNIELYGLLSESINKLGRLALKKRTFITRKSMLPTKLTLVRL
jgi:hypothetical protein